MARTNNPDNQLLRNGERTIFVGERLFFGWRRISENLEESSYNGADAYIPFLMGNHVTTLNQLCGRVIRRIRR